MDKKGFTLVEIMAVLVILCLIMLVGVPSINKTLKSQEKKAERQYINTLCTAAKNYARHNPKCYEELFEQDDEEDLKICIKTLYNKGYISSTLKNPDGYKDKDVEIMLTRRSDNDEVICTIKTSDHCDLNESCN